MEVNALLVKKLLDDNSNREFFVEESFPLDWIPIPLQRDQKTFSAGPCSFSL